MLNAYLEKELSELQDKGLKRVLRDAGGFQGPLLHVEGRELLNLCSNNYLGLASDSRLGHAAVECIKKEGFGSGASRLVCGNMSAHRALEKKLAKFKGSESCIVFSTGYMANVGIISSLFGRDDVIFCDKLNHASILDGIVLSQAKMKRYPHCDMDALEKMLKEEKGGKKRAIITDSVFSMDGDFAPLDKIVELAQEHQCIVMIDEAHALGVMGKKGKGLAEHFGVEKDIDIQMGTLSKAAGSFGAYCCGSKLLISYLINKARSFIYTTGMPASTAAASMRAIEIIERDEETRKKLLDNARYMRAQINLIGFDTLRSQTPIIPIMVKDSQKAVEFSNRLFEAGIYVSAIRPPTVPANTARLRLTVMATHAKKQLDFALDKLQIIGKDLCLI